IRAVTVAELPSLYGEGLSYSLFEIEPCGINLPHEHPRATELLYVIDADFLRTAHVEENGGARTIVNDLQTGSVTFFPQGLIHYQQNLGCKPATYISALNSEDPGVVTITTRFFELPPEAAADSLGVGDADVERLITGLPAGPAAGRAECLARCDL
ncbi:RmlC-like cupin domain-containing protein, partial [Pelagophyceae sp. CCMP2097]